MLRHRLVLSLSIPEKYQRQERAALIRGKRYDYFEDGYMDHRINISSRNYIFMYMYYRECAKTRELEQMKDSPENS